jgi:hypothetical protein
VAELLAGAQAGGDRRRQGHGERPAEVHPAVGGGDGGPRARAERAGVVDHAALEPDA